MQYPVLNFIRKFLSENHIQSFILDSPASYPDSFDLNLRNMLYNTPNYHQILSNLQKEYCQKDIYFLSDFYCCKYALIRIPKNGQLLIGPFTYLSFTDTLFLKLAKKLHFPQCKLDLLKQYYFSLPHIKDEDFFQHLLLSFTDTLYGSNYTYTVAFVESAFQEKEMLETYSDANTSSDSLDYIEKRNDLSERLCNAVRAANTGEALQLLNQFLAYSHGQRFHDSLKDTKNWLIIFNTHMRTSVLQAHVHPYYAGQLSRKFSFRIDALTNPDHKSRIMHDMVRQYCMLVKKYSVSEYSDLIHRCLILIDYDISANLSLKSIAAQLNINASYLSGRFKKEVNITLTDFVNKKRVEKALVYLNSTDLQIQIIAHRVGIDDVAYFTKLFKKQIGMTPSQYRNFIRHNNSAT